MLVFPIDFCSCCWRFVSYLDHTLFSTVNYIYVPTWIVEFVVRVWVNLLPCNSLKWTIKQPGPCAFWCTGADEYCSGRDLGGRNHSNLANKESTTGLFQKASLISSGAQPFRKTSKSFQIRYRNDLVNTAAKKYIMKGMIVNPEVMGSVGLAHGRKLREPSYWDWQRAGSKTFRATFPYFSIVEFGSYNFFVVDSVLFIDCFRDPWIPTHQIPVTFVMKIFDHTGVLRKYRIEGIEINGWKGTIDKIVFSWSKDSYDI